MLFDSTLLFFHTGNVYNFTAGEFVSMAALAAAGSTQSSTINLGNPRDMGVGQGQETPQLALYIGTAITSSDSTATLNVQFQGSTNNVSWTTYVETGTNTTASYGAGAVVLPMDIPPRPQGAGLPLYYRINANWASTPGASISTGTIIGGIVLARDEFARTGAQYPSGFTVA